MIIQHLRRPYVYIVFVGLLAALVIVDRYFPEYRQLLCDAMKQTSDGPETNAYCSPHQGKIALPILLALAFTLTAAALAILPVPDKPADIHDQANKAKTLENSVNPNRHEDAKTMAALWQELSIRARQFRIVVLMSLLSPILFFCFRGVDEVIGTRLLIVAAKPMAPVMGITLTGTLDSQGVLTVAAFGILYSLLAIGVATFGVYGFSLADFSRSQVAWRVAAGGIFYAGLTTVFASVLFAPTAWLTGWEYFVIRLTVAPILAGICALVIVSRSSAHGARGSLVADTITPHP